MNETLMIALKELLPGADEEGQWIVLYTEKNEVDVLSNMGDLEERRQLLAKVDMLWEDIVESEKNKTRRL